MLNVESVFPVFASLGDKFSEDQRNDTLAGELNENREWQLAMYDMSSDQTYRLQEHNAGAVRVSTT